MTASASDQKYVFFELLNKLFHVLFRLTFRNLRLPQSLKKSEILAIYLPKHHSSALFLRKVEDRGDTKVTNGRLTVQMVTEEDHPSLADTNGRR